MVDDFVLRKSELAAGFFVRKDVEKLAIDGRLVGAEPHLEGQPFLKLPAHFAGVDDDAAVGRVEIKGSDRRVDEVAPFFENSLDRCENRTCWRRMKDWTRSTVN